MKTKNKNKEWLGTTNMKLNENLNRLQEKMPDIGKMWSFKINI
jgi:hypothetical protein